MQLTPYLAYRLCQPNDLAFHVTAVETDYQRFCHSICEHASGPFRFRWKRPFQQCQALSLAEWVQLALHKNGSGPLFRPVNRHDKVANELALTPQSVALIVKSAVAGSKGLDAAKFVSGHSLRAGFCTEAATMGLKNSAIMGQSGHKSMEMAFRYVRPVQKRQIPSLL